MTLFVVRHAHAGRRDGWVGEDALRPLSPRGIAEAAAVTDLIAPRAPARILSSPAVRCVQTVEPLATALGLEVLHDKRLAERTPRQDIRSLVDEVASGDTVVCTHGDVIPLLLQLLVDDGMRPDRNLVWQKGSTWVVERADGGWATGRYVAPPART